MTGFLHFEQLLATSRDENTFLSAIAEESACFYFSYSPERRCLVAWTKNTEQVLGVKELVVARDGNLFLRHAHPDDRFTLLTELEQGLRGLNPYRATYRWIRPDNNETRWLHCRAHITRIADDIFFEGLIIDLTNEFTGTISRIAGPDSLATVLDALPTITFTVDSELRLLRVNRPRGQLPFYFGDPGFKHELFKVGRPLLACFSDPNQRSYLETTLKDILSGKLTHFRTRMANDASIYSLEITALREPDGIHGLLFVASDVTEIVALERKIAELNKTEGLRLLAAGVAHNFNNVLQGIVAQAAIIKHHVIKPELVTASSQAIIDLVERAAALAKQLSVVESESQATVPVDLNLAVMAAVSRIEELFSQGFKIGVAFGNPPAIAARQELLAEAIEALLRNASESMQAGGSLSVKTYQVSLTNGQVETLGKGVYAKLSIVDSGSGMPEAVRARCLEPFYTTKNADPIAGLNLQGKGLGLSRALSIFRQFGGGLTIESQSGMGTQVNVYLPALASKLESTTIIAEGQQPQVLIVDDDLMVLKTMQALLQDLGYSCRVTDDAKEALHITQHASLSLKLVLVDALMPSTDGATLIKQIRRVNKSITIVGFSGADAVTASTLLDAGALELLTKPVLPSEVQAVLRRYILSAV
jgi:signal transduction histidine kinase/ActR/RegA family two-component response regulator